MAEAEYTAITSRKGQAITARLIVRRVKDLNRKAAQGRDELFPLWRYHAVFTDSPFTLAQAEEQHPAAHPPKRPDQPRPGHHAPRPHAPTAPRKTVSQDPRQEPMEKPQKRKLQKTHARRRPQDQIVRPGPHNGNHLNSRGGSRLRS